MFFEFEKMIISNLFCNYIYTDLLSSSGIKGILLSYLFVLPEFLLLNLLLLTICYIVFVAPASNLKGPEMQLRIFNWTKNIVIVSVLGLLLFLSQCLKDTNFSEFVNNNGLGSKIYLFNDQLLYDWPTIIFKIFILIVFFGIISIFRSYCAIYKLYNFEFLLILILGFAGSLIIISSFDLLILYIAIELQALAFYALAAFRTDSVISAEAAIKYFILGAFASILWLWGASLVYGATGLTNFLHLSYFTTAAYSLGYEDLSLMLGVLLILVGLLFKLGIAPFHLWLPDVYQGSPLAVTAFFSTVPKISLFFILIKFYYIGLGSTLFMKINSSGNFEFIVANVFVDYINTLFLFCGFFSVLIGSLVGIGQHNIKRLFAYSSIVNAGFIILSLGCGTVYGLESSLIYLIVYILLTVNLFAILIVLKMTQGASLFNISHFSEINSPLLGLLLSLNLFSLAGIPPLLGFHSKLFVYLALMDSGHIILTLLVAVCTIFSAFYYVRLVALIFFIPSVRALVTSIIAVPSYVISSYIQKCPSDDLVYILVLTSLLNIYLFFNLDFVILLTTKFIMLFLN
jgi:NADH-quinone oxidoreductase subunit N